MKINREPDFRNIEAVLEKRIPSRPTLFEFYLNNRLYSKYGSPYFKERDNDVFPEYQGMIMAYKNLGYDYATIKGCDLSFKPLGKKTQRTISLNDNVKIWDRESFNKFPWPDPEEYDYSRLKEAEDFMPSGMKLIVFGAGGVLENVITLLGYENLCMLLYDDPQLVEDVFEKVGTIFIQYYDIVSKYPSVGAVMSNDDWGFNTQTMLSVDDMRRLVFPWHKEIVRRAHQAGKYAILHSCGNYSKIEEDIINDMKYDAKHSYEDNIIPVEKAYEAWRGKIAVLGGLDLNFMICADEEEIFNRSRTLVEASMRYGGYALGTGNSVPDYVPDSHYEAMIRAALVE
ncbi:hypothetical protein GPL15_03985 [Clostridium sp. MCC353]|uniref:uroporphyrinogen decarboxylase family protein n=1 Tax=Clostridium sp. MCC353 TaxID=2592646 RepID=UPI001C03A29E|nr:uroporphyrinogen decarboxylase family protein [Clostridium sp. MCC353]MBT9775672.1 hypothetical protein [Clostridium sp. MCC353]